MISPARRHRYEARRAVLIATAILAGAALAFELTVHAHQGFKAYLNAGLDLFLALLAIYELRHHARTDFLAFFIGGVYGGLSIVGLLTGTAFTHFGPEATLTLMVLVGIIYTATRDRLTSWPVYLFSSFAAVYSVIAILAGDVSSGQVLGLLLFGIGGQMIGISMIHRMTVRLHHTWEAQAAQVRMQRALAQCSQALLSRRGDQPLNTALVALLDATEASYAYIDVNRDGPGGLHWEIVADTRVEGYSDDVPIQGNYSQMREAEALLRAGQPAKLGTSELSGELRAQYENAGVMAELMAPIQIGERWVGSIGYTDPLREGIWTEAEVEGLMRAADMVGAYLQREAAQEGLMELAEAKDRFVAVISHELRTPLTAVMGFAGELAHNAEQYDSEELAEMADFVYTQSQELTELVNDLLTSERAASGNLTITSGDVLLLEECNRAVESILDRPPVEVSGTEVAARADGLRTRQILRNLITNAVKYGGDTIRVEVTAKGATARVTVTDDGAGVSSPDGERIFDPYYRAAESESKPDSVGLGLSVARQLARLMNGDLVYRRQGEFTVFELTLPLGEMPAMAESVSG